MSSKRIILLLVAILSFQGAFSQADSLVMFTKTGCANCQAAKLQLHQNRIAFKEYNLESDVHGRRMLQLLAKAGYKERIYLPVILLNNKLLHPAFQRASGLATVALPDVVDTIVSRQKRGEIHLPIETNLKTNETISAEAHTADCEINASTFYLISAEFESELEAKKEMDNLIQSGYIYAGFLFSKGKYQVYTKFFFDQSMANAELQRVKQSGGSAYLIEVK